MPDTLSRSRHNGHQRSPRDQRRFHSCDNGAGYPRDTWCAWSSENPAASRWSRLWRLLGRRSASLPEGRPSDPPSSVEVGVVGRSHHRFYWSNRVLMQRLAPPTLSPCVSLWPPPAARRSNRACRPGPRPLCPESRRPPRPPTCARRHLSRPAYASIPARRRSAACRVPRTPGSGWRRRSTARPRHAPAGASGPVSMLRTGPPRRSGTLATKRGPPRVARLGRREGYPSLPPTPPCVRFRTRRFKCSAADPGVESEGSGVPTPQASDCSRPHACARPPRSTRRSPGGGGLARTRSLESQCDHLDCTRFKAVRRFSLRSTSSSNVWVCGPIGFVLAGAV